MLKRFIIIVIIAALMFPSLLFSQQITGSPLATLGRQSVFEINGVETATWKINSAGCDFNVDSDTLKIYVTPYRKGEATLYAAIVIDSKPALLEYSFTIVDDEYNPTPNPQPEPQPKPEPTPSTLDEWLAANKPILTDKKQATFNNIFRSVAKNAPNQTAQQTFNSIRVSLTAYFSNDSNIQRFADGLEIWIKDLSPNDLQKALNAVANTPVTEKTTVSDCPTGTCPNVANSQNATTYKRR